MSFPTFDQVRANPRWDESDYDTQLGVLDRWTADKAQTVDPQQHGMLQQGRFAERDSIRKGWATKAEKMPGAEGEALRQRIALDDIGDGIMAAGGRARFQLEGDQYADLAIEDGQWVARFPQALTPEGVSEFRGGESRDLSQFLSAMGEEMPEGSGILGEITPERVQEAVRLGVAGEAPGEDASELERGRHRYRSEAANAAWNIRRADLTDEERQSEALRLHRARMGSAVFPALSQFREQITDDAPGHVRSAADMMERAMAVIDNPESTPEQLQGAARLVTTAFEELQRESDQEAQLVEDEGIFLMHREAMQDATTAMVGSRGQAGNIHEIARQMLRSQMGEKSEGMTDEQIAERVERGRILGEWRDSSELVRVLDGRVIVNPRADALFDPRLMEEIEASDATEFRKRQAMEAANKMREREAMRVLSQIDSQGMSELQPWLEEQGGVSGLLENEDWVDRVAEVVNENKNRGWLKELGSAYLAGTAEIGAQNMAFWSLVAPESMGGGPDMMDRASQLSEDIQTAFREPQNMLRAGGQMQEITGQAMESLATSIQPIMVGGLVTRPFAAMGQAARWNIGMTRAAAATRAGTTTMSPAAATTLRNLGFATSILESGRQSFSGNAKEYYDIRVGQFEKMGMDPDEARHQALSEARRYGLSMGIKTALVTGAFGKTGFEGWMSGRQIFSFGEVARQVRASGTGWWSRKALAETAKALGRGMGQMALEGLEETTDEIFDALGTYRLDPSKPFDEVIDEVLTAAFAGVMSVGGAGTVSAPFSFGQSVMPRTAAERQRSADARQVLERLNADIQTQEQASEMNRAIEARIETDDDGRFYVEDAVVPGAFRDRTFETREEAEAFAANRYRLLYEQRTRQTMEEQGADMRGLDDTFLAVAQMVNTAADVKGLDPNAIYALIDVQGETALDVGAQNDARAQVAEAIQTDAALAADPQSGLTDLGATEGDLIADTGMPQARRLTAEDAESGLTDPGATEGDVISDTGMARQQRVGEVDAESGLTDPGTVEGDVVADTGITAQVAQQPEPVERSERDGLQDQEDQGAPDSQQVTDAQPTVRTRDQIRDEQRQVEERISAVARRNQGRLVGLRSEDQAEWDSLHKRRNELAGELQEHPESVAERENDEAARQEKIKQEVDENDARIAALPIHQRRNGWEIVKDGPEYVLRDPNDKTEVYRGRLTRVREVADESQPEAQPAPEAEAQGAGVEQQAPTTPSTKEQLQASEQSLLSRYTKKEAERVVANHRRLARELPVTEQLHEHRVAGFVTRNSETGAMTLHVLTGNERSKQARVVSQVDVTDQYAAQPSQQPSTTASTRAERIEAHVAEARADERVARAWREQAAEGEPLAQEVVARLPRQEAQPEAQAADTPQAAVPTSREVDEAIQEWGAYVEDVLKPRQQRVRELESKVFAMRFDARTIEKDAQGRRKATIKSVLQKYNVQNKGQLNALFQGTNDALSSAQKLLQEAEQEAARLAEVKDNLFEAARDGRPIAPPVSTPQAVADATGLSVDEARNPRAARNALRVELDNARQEVENVLDDPQHTDEQLADAEAEVDRIRGLLARVEQQMYDAGMQGQFGGPTELQQTQEAGGVRRGRIQFTDDQGNVMSVQEAMQNGAARALVSLTRHSNASTVLHEMVHAMRGIQFGDGTSLFDAALGDTRDAFNRWATDDGNITDRVTIEERIARGAEQYMKDGILPEGAPEQVATAFERLAKVFRDIYAGLKQAFPPLNEAARAGFDAVFGMTPSQRRRAADRSPQSPRQAREAQVRRLRNIVQAGNPAYEPGGKKELEQRDEALTPEREAEYMAAVESGDMETAQRMVSEEIESLVNALPDSENENRIPNTASISASLTNPIEIGVKEVPTSWFAGHGKKAFYAKNDRDHVDALMQDIRENGVESPLIVVVDGSADGIAYVLEGGHRLAAIEELGVQSFPALVVYDGSEDVVFRDKSGNVIPLSQRFAPDSLEQRDDPAAEVERGLDESQAADDFQIPYNILGAAQALAFNVWQNLAITGDSDIINNDVTQQQWVDAMLDQDTGLTENQLLNLWTHVQQQAAIARETANLARRAADEQDGFLPKLNETARKRTEKAAQQTVPVIRQQVTEDGVLTPEVARLLDTLQAGAPNQTGVAVEAQLRDAIHNAYRAKYSRETDAAANIENRNEQISRKPAKEGDILQSAKQDVRKVGADWLEAQNARFRPPKREGERQRRARGFALRTRRVLRMLEGDSPITASELESYAAQLSEAMAADMATVARSRVADAKGRVFDSKADLKARQEMEKQVYDWIMANKLYAERYNHNQISAIARALAKRAMTPTGANLTVADVQSAVEGAMHRDLRAEATKLAKRVRAKAKKGDYGIGNTGYSIEAGRLAALPVRSVPNSLLNYYVKTMRNLAAADTDPSTFGGTAGIQALAQTIETAMEGAEERKAGGTREMTAAQIEARMNLEDEAAAAISELGHDIVDGDLAVPMLFRPEAAVMREVSLADIENLSDGKLRALIQHVATYRETLAQDSPVMMPALWGDLTRAIRKRIVYDAAKHDLNRLATKIENVLAKRRDGDYLEKFYKTVQGMGLVPKDATRQATKEGIRKALDATPTVWLDSELGMTTLVNELIGAPFGFARSHSMMTFATLTKGLDKAFVDLGNETSGKARRLVEAAQRIEAPERRAAETRFLGRFNRKMFQRELAARIVNAYLLQRQLEANPDAFPGVENFIEASQNAAIPDRQMRGEEQYYQRIAIAALRQVVGQNNTLSAANIFEVMSPKMRDMVNVHDGIMLQARPYVEATQTTQSREALQFYQAYTPIRSYGESRELTQAEEQQSLTEAARGAGENVARSMRAGASHNRTKKVGPTSYDLISNVKEHLNQVITDYHMTPVFRTMREVFNVAIQENRQRVNESDPAQADAHTRYGQMLEALRDTLADRMVSEHMPINRYADLSTTVKTAAARTFTNLAMGRVLRPLQEIAANTGKLGSLFFSEGGTTADVNQGFRDWQNERAKITDFILQGGGNILARSGRVPEMQTVGFATKEGAYANAEFEVTRMLKAMGDPNQEVFAPTAPGMAALSTNPITQAADATLMFSIVAGDTVSSRPWFTTYLNREYKRETGEALNWSDPNLQWANLSDDQRAMFRRIIARADTWIAKGITPSTKFQQSAQAIQLGRKSASGVSEFGAWALSHGLFWLTSFQRNQYRLYADAIRQSVAEGNPRKAFFATMAVALENYLYLKTAQYILWGWRGALGALFRMIGLGDEDDTERTDQARDFITTTGNPFHGDFYRDMLTLGLGGIGSTVAGSGSQLGNMLRSLPLEAANRWVRDSIMDRPYSPYRDAMLRFLPNIPGMTSPTDRGRPQGMSDIPVELMGQAMPTLFSGADEFTEAARLFRDGRNANAIFYSAFNVMNAVFGVPFAGDARNIIKEYNRRTDEDAQKKRQRREEWSIRENVRRYIGRDEAMERYMDRMTNLGLDHLVQRQIIEHQTERQLANRKLWNEVRTSSMAEQAEQIIDAWEAASPEKREQMLRDMRILHESDREVRQILRPDGQPLSSRMPGFVLPRSPNRFNALARYLVQAGIPVGEALSPPPSE